MNVVWSVDVDEILSQGIYLDSVGVKNWALDRFATLNAISKLCDIGVPISGGDVYIVINRKIEGTYDNWYCDRLDGEVALDFAKRSAEKAIDYVKGYNSEAALFTIVPQI
jgi:hypothetical protein